MTPRIVTAREAAALIPDGATVASDGFTMMAVADELLSAVEQSFLHTGRPRGLTWVHAAGQSNRTEGLARVAHAGLLSRVVGSHWGLNPPMAELLGGDEVECLCLPQGQLSTLYRTIAAGRPGQLSTVGLGTFVDPRLDGGRLNAAARRGVPATEYVDVVELDGREYLRYKPFPLQVGIIRGTRMDTDGNLSQEDEPTILDSLAIAQAVHNQGGLVIAQVKEIVEPGAIPARAVNVPGVLVDVAAVCSDPGRYHRQSHSFPQVDASLLTGHVSAEQLGAALDREDLPESRASIGRRGIALIEPGDVVNLGSSSASPSLPFVVSGGAG